MDKFDILVFITIWLGVGTSITMLCAMLFPADNLTLPTKFTITTAWPVVGMLVNYYAMMLLVFNHLPHGFRFLAGHRHSRQS